MKRNALIIGVVFSLFATACGAQATPTVNPVDIQHTAEAAAFTMVAQTLESMPTSTPLPPTETPVPTLAATNTPLPTLTPDGLSTTPAAAGITPAANIPTFTPQASSGSGQDPCNQPLTSWEGPTANFTVVNETKPLGTIVLSMYVVTELGQCGYLAIFGDSFSGPIGQYSAGAFVTGKQNLKVFGGFCITQGSWKIAINNESIIARGGCYPSC